MNPTSTKVRIHELDYIRGFALMGIIFLNIPVLLHSTYDFSMNDLAYRKFLDLYVESKFFSIFSFLFGIGFYIFMDRAKDKAENQYVLYLRRIVVLAIFGFLHMQLQPGEALFIYAIFGLFLLPVFKMNKWINLIIGLILLLLVISVDVKTVMPLPLFILGLTFAQFDLHNKFNQHRMYYAIIMVISLLISIVGIYFMSQTYVGPSYEAIQHTGLSVGEYNNRYDETGNNIIRLSPVISVFYFTFLVTIIQFKVVQKLLIPLRFYGRMALSNYIGQTLLILLFGYLLNMYEAHLTVTGQLAIMIVVVQLFISSIWLTYFKYGPLEYIWKVCTYFKKFAIK